MARSLLVWGLNPKDWSHEKGVMTGHGCTSRLELYEDFNEAWCTVCFASLTAARACAATLQQDFTHLSVCVEPDWQFGKTKATATADLIRVAEWLGCREELHVLPVPKVFRLMQGADAVLAAVKVAGGAHVLAARDPAAAMCLGHGLMQRPITRHRAEHVFAVLGPDMLRFAAGDVRSCQPGSPQRACVAVWLAAALMRTDPTSTGLDVQLSMLSQLRGQRLLTLEAVSQAMAPDCMKVLQAVVDVLAPLSSILSKAVQQRDPQLQETASAVHFSSSWLLGAASSLLEFMAENELCCMVHRRQLLDTLGQLLPKVVLFVQVEERAAAAGQRLLNSYSLTAAECVGQLHYAVETVLRTPGKAACSSVGLPALDAVILEALRTALDDLAAPRHLALLLYLSRLAHLTVQGGARHKEMCTLMAQLARLQQLAVTWLSAPQEVPSRAISQTLPDFEQIPSSEDQLALLMDVTAYQLGDVVIWVFDNTLWDGGRVDTDCIFESGAVNALTAALQAAPCKNVRERSGSLSHPARFCCMAAGQFHAAIALTNAVQLAIAAADGCKAWATNAVAALVRAGLGSYRLAQAEAAAQAAVLSTNPAAAALDTHLPAKAQRHGASILAGATWCLTPPMSRTLASPNLAGLLLEALPWRSLWPEAEANIEFWQATVHGTKSVSGILRSILVADASTRAAVLQGGSLDAAVRRVRDLRPPAALAAAWAKEHEELHVTTAKMKRWSVGGRRTAHHGKADADAVAAAERAMQELLANEQPAEAPSKRNKAGSKRARKKAAKQQQPGAIPEGVQVAAAEPQPTAVTSSTAVPEADPQQPEAGQLAAAQCEWFRCPLSGEVMRDPVLYGSEGHSFERAALEQWLAANPGVDPLTLQLLPTGTDSMLPNHALRNIVQQLRLV